jgi:hypothetical protein
LVVLIPARRRGDLVAEMIADLPHLAGNLMHDTHGHPHARAWNCKNLYAGHDFSRFPSLGSLLVSAQLLDCDDTQSRPLRSRLGMGFAY